jgi:hypothetical protein
MGVLSFSAGILLLSTIKSTAWYHRKGGYHHGKDEDYCFHGRNLYKISIYKPRHW